ncbi:hypothetical protein [Cohnella soli]|uniref:Diacylglycerol glucosyltransferase N-terminal domain-containing protein n=1 Tax=Cohnella soli TaxID=425005 RepID=A0ABW0I1T5_9BACL
MKTMKSEAKVRIYYSSFGDGHLQAALALQQSFASMGIHRVTLIDLFAEAYPRLDVISRYFYLRSAVHFPWLYGLLYKISNRPTNGWLGRFFQFSLDPSHAESMKAAMETVRRSDSAYRISSKVSTYCGLAEELRPITANGERKAVGVHV